LPDLLAQGRLLRLAIEASWLMRRGMTPRAVASLTIRPLLPNGLWRAFNQRNSGGRRLETYAALSPTAADQFDLAATAAERRLNFDYQPRRDAFESRLWVMRLVDMGNFHKATLAGWGLDLRDPTADRRLVEFCLNVPLEQFMRRGEPRALARRVFADRIAPQVLAETRRGYQGADWHMGMAQARQAIGDEIARLEDVPRAAELLDLPRLGRLASDPPPSDWTDWRAIHSHRAALLRGVALGHFLRKAGRTNA
jgi:asparagine synthase (glutamine-hydrolysing)